MPVAVEKLLSFFDESRFVPALRARSKAGVLKELAAALATDDEIRHPELLLEALEAREKLGSTGIGKDVAIPHSRTLSVPSLTALVARSRKGVDWGAPDGKPVKLFFLVVAPPQERSNHYLPLLGALVSGMQQKPNRDKLIQAKDWEGVAAALEGAFRA
ncbi:MAG TPA: PTS sugar transporter subunit IIA [bacterium]|nr:PTS sugar transporter subunit IIA [bacterium]